MTEATTTRPGVDFDPLDQAWRFDDGPIYDKIRAAGGIAWSSLHGGFWATPDLDLVEQVIGAPEAFKEEVEEIAGALFIYRTPMRDGSNPGARLKALLEQMVREATEHPRQDWLSAIVGRRCPFSESLSDAELSGAVMALMVGGHHTTVRVASSLIAEIAASPELQARLREKPALIATAINEAVRL